MQAARFLARPGARAPLRPSLVLSSLSPRPVHLSARLLANEPPGTTASDDEKRELEMAQRERDLETIARRKLKDAKSAPPRPPLASLTVLAPLAKWIRQDDTLPERERMKAMVDKIRELYPDRAKAADAYINTLDMGVLLQQVLLPSRSFFFK